MREWTKDTGKGEQKKETLMETDKQDIKNSSVFYWLISNAKQHKQIIWIYLRISLFLPEF